MNGFNDWMVSLAQRAMLEDAGVLDPGSYAGRQSKAQPRSRETGRVLAGLALAMPLLFLAGALLAG